MPSINRKQVNNTLRGIDKLRNDVIISPLPSWTIKAPWTTKAPARRTKGLRDYQRAVPEAL
jgi:hypothetical protein